MLEFVSLIQEVHPGLFVYSIFVEEDLEQDKKAGFVGGFRFPQVFAETVRRCSMEISMNSWNV